MQQIVNTINKMLMLGLPILVAAWAMSISRHAVASTPGDCPRVNSYGSCPSPCAIEGIAKLAGYCCGTSQTQGCCKYGGFNVYCFAPDKNTQDPSQSCGSYFECRLVNAWGALTCDGLADGACIGTAPP